VSFRAVDVLNRLSLSGVRRTIDAVMRLPRRRHFRVLPCTQCLYSAVFACVGTLDNIGIRPMIPAAGDTLEMSATCHYSRLASCRLEMTSSPTYELNLHFLRFLQEMTSLQTKGAFKDIQLSRAGNRSSPFFFELLKFTSLLHLRYSLTF